ncbi:MAG TPA: zinc ribbon domain-containing protein, partial [Desulfobulbaceae bacterium]|nr:zinc ribbon domain-containing protein [Desulfobulbaceae bacterium]
MPIYEYRCDICQNIFEVLTSAGSQNEKVLCSKCG